jgi:hypothetical protein
MRVFRRSHRVSGALVVLAALNAVPAAAQQAEANLLFDEGRAAMAKRDHAQAITKLEQSQRLDAAVGTLLNLGECYAALGRSASAWVTYREAASLASSMKQRDRERFASRKAQELEPRLSHLELVVAPEARPPGLVITRGAISIPEGLWGSSIPVDPGVQHLEAKAPGRATWTLDVNVGESADKVRVEVPVLELAASPSPSPPPAPPASPSAPLAPPVTASPAFPTTLPAIDHSADERPRSSLPTIGWVSVTAGGVAALTGVLVFVNGRSQIDDANCPNEVWRRRQKSTRRRAAERKARRGAGHHRRRGSGRGRRASREWEQRRRPREPLAWQAFQPAAGGGADQRRSARGLVARRRCSGIMAGRVRA